MKKNKMMRLASMLLVAVLITTCAISGTFAKYVTSGEAKDSARVAAFGVEVTASTGLFATEYAADDTTKSLDLSVSATENVVAPGTTGSIAGATIEGTPEVAVEVAYSAATLTLDDWTLDDGTFYCPIVFTIGSTPIDGTLYTDKDALVEAVQNALTAASAVFPAGTDLENADIAALGVTWAWAFSGDDTKDTQLGNATNAAEIALDLTITVTQID